ncbi:MAG: hypothetical protein JNG90_09205 [Planctomycetaceae bacterium]|nr:hypothetical protein [Planctomycetaceae bacterium]
MTDNPSGRKKSDRESEPDGRFPFRLWYLFASILCFSAAFGLLRWTMHLVDRYGGGVFPLLCLGTVVVIVIVGVMFLSRRAAHFLGRIALTIVEFLLQP